MKGYILVDIPKDCSHCDCVSYWHDYNSYECGLVSMRDESIVDKYVTEKKRPDWCPIKKLPVKFKNIAFDPERDAIFEAGYNQCLDDILKE